jgi:acetolactate synthase I/III small subunit
VIFPFSEKFPSSESDFAFDRSGHPLDYRPLSPVLRFRIFQQNPAVTSRRLLPSLPAMTLHTISVLVENKFGVLARVAGMFSGRGYNIHTLNVGPSHDPKISRMTIVVREKENVLNQIIKQLDKLIDVIQVIDFRESEYVDRELVLLSVRTTSQTRAEVIELCNIFRTKIIDVGLDQVSIEITGDSSKISKFIALMESFGITELTRTGKIALPRV